MNSERSRRVHENPQTDIEEAIYYEAVGKAEDEREAYLAGSVRPRSPPCWRVSGSLLKAHEIGDGFLEVRPVGSWRVHWTGPPSTEGPGTVIGRYKLLEKIGEGGMAVVYMAEQEQPIRRKVALKIIKLGMDTRQVIARFEAERQALALMDHPSIAKVLDAGATETGRPYFVMELVQGVSITEYCDRNSLSTKDRLGLFIQVCHAVQHAHQKGIIHRDLKPSNVMVTHHDGKPVPKVIDFGIAKAINQKLTEKTLFTRYAHLIGTPAYMSPEQAELSDLDIDTRSDIYSLGVLLYELLTGTTPFSEEELRKAGYIEMQRVIREQEPVKPSTKISTLGDTSTEIAKRRSSTPDLLRKSHPRRSGLDRDEVPGEGPHPPVRDRQCAWPRMSSDTLPVSRSWPEPPARRIAWGSSSADTTPRSLPLSRWWSSRRPRWSCSCSGIGTGSNWRRPKASTTGGILSQAREQYAKADREAALETIRPILDSRHVGPEARLLQAGILVDEPPFRRGQSHAEESAAMNAGRLPGRPIRSWPASSGRANRWMPRSSRRSRSTADRPKTLLPETAEAYFLRAMTADHDQRAACRSGQGPGASTPETTTSLGDCGPSRTTPPGSTTACSEDALVMTILRPT